MNSLRYSIRNVTRAGRKDGRSWTWFIIPKPPYPPIDQKQPSNFEREIAAFMNEKIQNIGEVWKNTDAALFARCKDLLENHIAKNLKALFLAENDLGEANTHLEHLNSEFQEFSEPSLGPPWSWLLFFALFVADLFFNGVVFECFGQTRLETALMAFATVVAVSLIPHSIGRKVKSEERTELESRLTVALAISLLVGILAIGWIRMKYLIDLQFLKWSHIEAFVVFVSINFLVCVAFVIVGYKTGHEKPNQYRRTKRKLREAKETTKQKGKTAKELQEKQKELETLFFETHSRRRAAPAAFQKKVDALTEEGISLIEAYRGENVKAQGRSPVCFQTKSELLLKSSQTFELDCTDCRYDRLQKSGGNKDLFMISKGGGG